MRRSLVCLSLLLAAGSLAGQSSLTTTFANNNGGAAGGTVTFDLQADVDCVVADFDLNFQQAAGVAGSVDVYVVDPGTAVGNELNAAAWTLHDTATVAATAGVGQPSLVTLNTPLTVTAGSTIGVALVCDANLSHAYTDGIGNDVYGDCPLRLVSNGASNAAFAPTLFFPRVVNATIRYTPAASTCASVLEIGVGCVDTIDALYEDLVQGSNDLVGAVISGTNSGAYYVVTVAPGAAEPLGNISSPTDLTGLLPDDGVISDPLGSGLNIGSNCWVGFGDLGGGFAPSVLTLLAVDDCVVSAWTDLDPTDPLSAVDAEFDGSTYRITYNAVVWGTQDLALVQIDIDVSSGDWVIRNEMMPATAPETQLIGFVPDAGAADNGPADISSFAATPGTVGNERPLSLSTLGAPVQGPEAAPFVARSGNIGDNALLHLGVIGLSPPGLPLAPFGLPSGCTLHASLDVIGVDLLSPPPLGGELDWLPITLPALPNSFVGFTFYLQSHTFDAGQPLLGPTTRSSNGLCCTVGTEGEVYHDDTLFIDEALVTTDDGPAMVTRRVRGRHRGNADEQISNLIIDRIMMGFPNELIHNANLTGCRVSHTTPWVQDAKPPGPQFLANSEADYRMTLVAVGCTGTGGVMQCSTMSSNVPLALSHQAGNSALVAPPMTNGTVQSVTWLVTGTALKVAQEGNSLRIRADANGNPGEAKVTCKIVTDNGTYEVTVTFETVT